MHIQLSRPKFRNTSRASSSFLKDVIRFCRPNDCGEIRIWFKRSPSGYFSGMCYGGSYVTCKIPDPNVFRTVYHSYSGNGYMDWKACTWEEATVALVAHELRHIWQRRNPNGRRVWGSRGIGSERDADAYAIRMLRQWRQSMPARLVAKSRGSALARFRVLAQSQRAA